MAEGSEDRRGGKIKFRKAILAIPRHTSEKTGLIDEPKDTVDIAVLKEERKEKKKRKEKEIWHESLFVFPNDSILCIVAFLRLQN